MIKARLLVYHCVKWLGLKPFASKPPREEDTVNAKEKYQKLQVGHIERFDQMSVERRPMKPPFLLVGGAVLNDRIGRKLLHRVWECDIINAQGTVR
jgi:hypothetical protein